MNVRVCPSRMNFGQVELDHVFRRALGGPRHGLFLLLAVPELLHNKFRVPRRPIVVSLTEFLLVLAVSLFCLS